MSNEIENTVQICNKKGLHARAAAKFVNLVEGHTAKVEVAKDGARVCGSSIMGLLMLGASIGKTITIYASGDGAEEILTTLSNLVKEGFGETE